MASLLPPVLIGRYRAGGFSLILAVYQGFVFPHPGDPHTGSKSHDTPHCPHAFEREGPLGDRRC